jgi:hypothetical protein
MMPGSSRLQHREHSTQVTEDGSALQLEGGLTIHKTGFGVASNLLHHFFLVHLYVFVLALRDVPQKNFDSEFTVVNARVFLGFQDASWLSEPNSTISTFVILSL